MFWERFYTMCISRGTKPNPVAKEIGISSGTVTKWKNGTIPNGDALLKIADYLGCSVDYLLGIESDPNSAKNAQKPTFVSEDGLSKAEQSLLLLFRQVPEKDRTMIIQMIEAALKSQGLL